MSTDNKPVLKNLKLALDDIEGTCKQVKSDIAYATHIMKEFTINIPLVCWDAAEIFIALPEECQMKLLSDQEWIKRMNREYSMLHKSFYICPEVQTLNKKLEMVSNKEELPKPGLVPTMLNALKIAVAAMQDNNLDESMAGEFEIITDAVTMGEEFIQSPQSVPIPPPDSIEQPSSEELAS